jgi:metallophosphoesterase superfamily enzyme
MLSTHFEHRPAAGFVHDIGASRVLLCGKSLIADPTGAMFWPAENTLIIADLQLSSGSYLYGRDVFLPPYDMASSFEKLEEALDRYDPEKVIVLGNSFEGLGPDGLGIHQRDWLQDMIEGRGWYWVTGEENTVLPAGINGEVVPQLTLSGIKFRAEAIRAPVANEIAGGLHPVAQVSQFGHVERGRCFVTNGMRLVMPSVGNYSAGRNVLSSVFDPYLAQGALFVWFLSQGLVHPVAPPQLIDDQLAA